MKAAAVANIDFAANVANARIAIAFTEKANTAIAAAATNSATWGDLMATATKNFKISVYRSFLAWLFSYIIWLFGGR